MCLISVLTFSLLVSFPPILLTSIPDIVPPCPLFTLLASIGPTLSETTSLIMGEEGLDSGYGIRGSI